MKGYLVLSDGTVFAGERIGATRDGIGELVFTTGMEGYLETLTDPSFAGQIVMHTFPLIGNYGVIPEDFEGKPHVKGYIVGELCDTPSDFRSTCELNGFLAENGIPGLMGVDTREITRIIREKGVVNAGIFGEVPKDLSPVSGFKIGRMVSEVSTKEKIFYPCGAARYRVALIDYGAKANIARCLIKRGCDVTVFPHCVSAEEVLSGGFNGVTLSNGPGDPAENVECISELKKIIGKLPVFGICLGHQLAALAMGGKTVKLKYGHRGGNQPVKDVLSGRTYITSQNHGYAVVSNSLSRSAREIFYNANDLSNEGLVYEGKMCFTVQFHPEAACGPHDTEFLFDKFMDLMEGKEYAAR